MTPKDKHGNREWDAYNLKKEAARVLVTITNNREEPEMKCPGCTRKVTTTGRTTSTTTGFQREDAAVELARRNFNSWLSAATEGMDKESAQYVSDYAQKRRKQREYNLTSESSELESDPEGAEELSSGEEEPLTKSAYPARTPSPLFQSAKELQGKRSESLEDLKAERLNLRRKRETLERLRNQQILLGKEKRQLQQDLEDLAAARRKVERENEGRKEELRRMVEEAERELNAQGPKAPEKPKGQKPKASRPRDQAGVRRSPRHNKGRKQDRAL